VSVYGGDFVWFLSAAGLMLEGDRGVETVELGDVIN
jgi:hypothetical protein